MAERKIVIFEEINTLEGKSLFHSRILEDIKVSDIRLNE